MSLDSVFSHVWMHSDISKWKLTRKNHCTLLSLSPISVKSSVRKTKATLECLRSERIHIEVISFKTTGRA